MARVGGKDGKDFFPLGFREVVPDQASEKWKDFTLNIGGTQSTLQGIKLPETAGGYCYKDTTKLYLRNRFIYWQVTQDVLELTEHSLDYNLSGHRVRYQFQDAPILSGVVVEETEAQVVVMVPTVCSVHRLVFPHPNRIHRQELAVMHMPNLTLSSIFADASIALARDPAHFHVLNNISPNIPAPHTATCTLISDREALFALAFEDGLIQVVKLGASAESTEVKMLKKSSLVNRLWSGWMSGVLRGVGGESLDYPASMQVVQCQSRRSKTGMISEGEIYLVALCRNNQLCLWSYRQAECLEVVDASRQQTTTTRRHQQQSESVSSLALAQHHLLRKAQDKEGRTLLATFMAFPSHRQFSVYQCRFGDGMQQMHHLVTVLSEESDLMDFVLTGSHLWALWTGSSTQPHLSYTSLYPGSVGGADWRKVILEDPPPRDPILPDQSMDPAQFYMDLVFKSGAFSTQTISKAFNIYRRSVGGLTGETVFSMEVLRSSVCSAVEAEVRREAADYELSDEEYVDLVLKCWARFYSRCVEYHLTGLKPMGLMVDSSNGLTCLIRKSVVSFLRPMDVLEYLWLTDSLSWRPEELHSTPIHCEDPSAMEDVLQLMSTVCTVGQHVPEEVQEGFRHSLLQLRPAEEVAKEVARSLNIHTGRVLYEDDDDEDEEEARLHGTFLDAIRRKTQNMEDYPKALSVLLSALSLDSLQRDSMAQDEPSKNELIMISHLLSGSLGVSLASRSLRQLANTRMSICQNLLILQQLSLQRSLSRSTVNRGYIADTAMLTQGYFTLCFLTNLLASDVSPASLEVSARQLSVMCPPESGEIDPIVGKVRHSPSLLLASRPCGVVEMFLQSEGGSHVRLRLAQRFQWSEEALSNCHLTFVQFGIAAAGLIWPMYRGFVFPQFLLTACQYQQIQEYVRLLEGWCEWNSCSRKFLLGYALLNMGEPEKALDWLVRASDGLMLDEFLASRVQFPVSDDAEWDGNQATVQYYLKVIQLFEQFGHSECVIELASLAIDAGNRDSPDMATLWSICFKSHLRLGHFSEAYDAMLSNPDAIRRKDCLREFIITMFEECELETLMSFPFDHLSEEVESIFESRARSSDLATTNYYDFLYAFHIKKGNMRKAATVMYEQIIRLGRECSGLSSLEKQSFCYLCCINVLQLVDQKYWWIVKPLPSVTLDLDKQQGEQVIPGNTFDGEEIPIAPAQNQVEVVDLDDLRKEHELVYARLELVRKSGDASLLTGSPLSAVDTCALLTNAHLYDHALRLCRRFGLSVQPVIEGLAGTCVRMSLQVSPGGDGGSNNEAWEWLAENNRENISVVGVNSASPVEQAWGMLRYHLEHLEEAKKSNLHKGIAKKLLSMGAFLPQWLVVSYRKRNAAELLRVYLDYGVLEDAANLVMSYIDAILGEDRKEKFGLSHTLQANAPPVWLPYHAIDQLLLELRDATQQVFKELHVELSQKLKHYFSVLSKVSDDMISAKKKAKCF